jgi:hypothetical protein
MRAMAAIAAMPAGRAMTAAVAAAMPAGSALRPAVAAVALVLRQARHRQQHCGRSDQQRNRPDAWKMNRP